MIRTIQRTLLLAFLPIATWAAGGGAKLMHAGINLDDKVSLQRGASTFVNYCMGCHSASYMRYNRMGKDLGISDDVLQANFIFDPDDKVGDTMDIAMRDEDAAKVYFGVNPPDLSVIARSRGPDWLYTYLMTFYKDESKPMGVNNLVFRDVGMPHVLVDKQGMQAPVYETVTTQEGGEKRMIKGLERISHGTETPEQYEQTVTDLVNFLVYLGEPAILKRKAIGFWVLFYLIVLLLPVAYLLKKEYWRDVH